MKKLAIIMCLMLIGIPFALSDICSAGFTDEELTTEQAQDCFNKNPTYEDMVRFCKNGVKCDDAKVLQAVQGESETKIKNLDPALKQQLITYLATEARISSSNELVAVSLLEEFAITSDVDSALLAKVVKYQNNMPEDSDVDFELGTLTYAYGPPTTVTNTGSEITQKITLPNNQFTSIETMSDGTIEIGTAKGKINIEEAGTIDTDSDGNILFTTADGEEITITFRDGSQGLTHVRKNVVSNVVTYALEVGDDYGNAVKLLEVSDLAQLGDSINIEKNHIGGYTVRLYNAELASARIPDSPLQDISMYQGGIIIDTDSSDSVLQVIATDITNSNRRYEQMIYGNSPEGGWEIYAKSVEGVGNDQSGLGDPFKVDGKIESLARSSLRISEEADGSFSFSNFKGDGSVQLAGTDVVFSNPNDWPNFVQLNPDDPNEIVTVRSTTVDGKTQDSRSAYVRLYTGDLDISDGKIESLTTPPGAFMYLTLEGKDNAEVSLRSVSDKEKLPGMGPVTVGFIQDCTQMMCVAETDGKSSFTVTKEVGDRQIEVAGVEVDSELGVAKKFTVNPGTDLLALSVEGDEWAWDMAVLDEDSNNKLIASAYEQKILVTKVPEYDTHEIVKGDTFFDLAVKYNVDVESIKKANPGVNPYTLAIGQPVNIPKDGGVSYETHLAKLEAEEAAAKDKAALELAAKQSTPKASEDEPKEERFAVRAIRWLAGLFGSDKEANAAELEPEDGLMH